MKDEEERERESMKNLQMISNIMMIKMINYEEKEKESLRRVRLKARLRIHFCCFFMPPRIEMQDRSWVLKFISIFSVFAPKGGTLFMMRSFRLHRAVKVNLKRTLQLIWFGFDL